MAITQMDYTGGGDKNCKSGTTINSGTFTPSTSAFTEIDIGFVPTNIVFWLLHTSGNALVILYDVTNAKYYRWYDGGAGSDLTSTFKDYIKMEGTTLKYKAPAAGQAVATNYIAIKE